MGEVVRIGHFQGPLGPVWTALTRNGVCTIALRGDRREFLRKVKSAVTNAVIQDDPVFHDFLYQQLDEYLIGSRTAFDIPLDLRGTAFQLKTWDALTKIPYGETRSYGEIASAVGNHRAVRAVGQANGRNPIPIIVPCHRVIRANGDIGGYGGGVDIKEALLALEAKSSRVGRWQSCGH